ncbi:type 1 fimbrial protein [Cronobacter turicensis]|nr:type 1 fimbrial protein [Cronobacter turicensis]ELQ6019781.1 type 1 fimbrial protein [Cronobacter turicensis]ELQ6076749.1 type 1 fimbrial protein [Cronobacter turicensis]ELQ6182436.1 type 1 fimbrial protein [Cronobacter turicensis]ELQ6232256.1 type 1 fimbrial protein [Cronobacter turicensis]
MRIVKLFSVLLVLAGSLLFMPHAKAAICTAPMMPYTVSVASIAVSSSLPVGSAIPGSDETINIHGSCPDYAGQVIIGCYYGNGSEVAGMPGVYHTGVEGIGITLVNDKGQRIIGGGIGCDTRNTPLGYVSNDSQKTFNFNVTLALVKTAETIVAGSLQQSQTVFGVGVYSQAPVGSPNNISYAGNITYKSVTCSVDPKELNIALGNVPATSFTGPGSASNWYSFMVNATCNDPVEVGVKVSSANGYASTQPSVIKLTPEAGVASGIGVHLLTNGQNTDFDHYVIVGDIPVANATLSIPFSLQYYQTSSTVTPGVANAVATITIAYR